MNSGEAATCADLEPGSSGDSAETASDLGESDGRGGSHSSKAVLAAVERGGVRRRAALSDHVSHGRVQAP
jgi:hypothetical protein